MADNTKIEWADATLNYANGCSRVSPGCGGPGPHGGCYAELLAGTRLRNHPTRIGLTRQTSTGPRWTGDVRIHEPALQQALAWKRGRKIFWNAHGDLFHEKVTDEQIDRLFAVCALTPQHTHMMLTKRSARMREYLTEVGLVRRVCAAAYQLHKDSYAGCIPEGKVTSRKFDRSQHEWWGHVGALTAWTVRGGVASDMFEREEPGRDYPSRIEWPLPNVWLGVSVEDQQRANERIPDLLATPAAVRFISAEPLLGPVDLTALEVNQGWDEMDGLNAINISAEWAKWCEASDQADDDETLAGFVEQYGRAPDGKPLHPTLDWVIAGGESGPKARPMHPDWIISLRDQCEAATVPFLFKQWGEHLPVHVDSITHSGVEFRRVGKKAAGRRLHGITHDEFPS